jgi:hypothetical protein
VAGQNRRLAGRVAQSMHYVSAWLASRPRLATILIVLAVVVAACNNGNGGTGY